MFSKARKGIAKLGKDKTILGLMVTPQTVLEPKELKLEGHVVMGEKDQRGVPAWPSPTVTRLLKTRSDGTRPYVILTSTSMIIPALPGQERFAPNNAYLSSAMRERFTKVRGSETTTDSTGRLLFINIAMLTLMLALVVLVLVAVLPNLIQRFPGFGSSEVGAASLFTVLIERAKRRLHRPRFDAYTDDGRDDPPEPLTLEQLVGADQADYNCILRNPEWAEDRESKIRPATSLPTTGRFQRNNAIHPVIIHWPNAPDGLPKATGEVLFIKKPEGLKAKLLATFWGKREEVWTELPPHWYYLTMEWLYQVPGEESPNGKVKSMNPAQFAKASLSLQVSSNITLQSPYELGSKLQLDPVRRQAHRSRNVGLANILSRTTTWLAVAMAIALVMAIIVTAGG